MLTSSEVDRCTAGFKHEGYAIVRGLLSPEEIQRARHALDQTIERRCGKVAADTPRNKRPEFIWENHLEEPFWFELCRHPKILDAVEDVLGPDLLLLMSGLIAKPPHCGYPVDWHQDNTYWPSVEGTDIVTVWLAVDDSDVENGCMCVVPRSHQGSVEMATIRADRDSVLKIKVEMSDEMKRAAKPVELKAGDASIHDSFILHGSSANTSARRRAGYTMRYANARTVKVDFERHPVPTFVVRGDLGGMSHARLVDARPGTKCSAPMAR